MISEQEAIKRLIKGPIRKVRADETSCVIQEKASKSRGRNFQSSGVERAVINREDKGESLPDPRISLLNSVLQDRLQIQAISLKLGLIDGQKYQIPEIAGIMRITPVQVAQNIRAGARVIQEAVVGK